MSGKRSAESELEEELERLCGPSKCEVCYVPIGSSEAAVRHYGGKIHGKKVARWKDQWLAQKKIKLETESITGSDYNNGSNGNEPEYSKGDNSVPVTAPEPPSVEPKREEIAVKREVIEDVQPEENTETVPPLAAASLDPKLLDQLDPAAMKKMLNIKKKNRWDTPDEDNGENKKDDPVEDDPYDFSIPVDFDKLMRRTFNPNTGLGYCQICNKLFRSQAEIMKHYRSSKHAGKVDIYHELLASEAAVLAGTAQPNPPPHRGFYCELCEADCSSDSQLEQHLCGDRHRTNLRGMERELASDPELDKDINPYNLPELWLRERKHCTLCDVPVNSIRMAKIHFNGRNHRLAAGLNITEASKMAEFYSGGDLKCESCNFSVATPLEMKSHQAGIRHLENDRTRAAVEETGGTWSCHHPTPSDPPKYSVQDPGNGWSGESIGLTPEMMMAGAGPNGPMGQHPGMMMGPGPMMGMFGPMMGGPMMPMMGMPGSVSEKRRYAGVDLENLKCEICEVKFTSKSQIDVHIQLPAHLEKAKDLPVEEEGEEEQKEPEPFVPVPLTADSISSVRTRSHSVHCPFCKVWFPSITILKYFHREEHKEALDMFVKETLAQPGEELTCAACKISASTAEELWEECQRTQKIKLFGSGRSHSCDMCDVHLSEPDWLEKHLQGEKHKWIAARVGQLLPVQFEPQEMVIVQKSDFNQFTWQYHFYPEWQCLVCKVGFTPIERYRKHLGSLFHLRKSAGEDVQWVEGGGYHF